MCETSRGTLGEVRDMLEDPRAGPKRVGGHWGRSGTGWGTFEEVRDGWGTLQKVRDGLLDPRVGPGWVKGPF